MTYALELQDRALALARDGTVLSIAPSAVALQLGTRAGAWPRVRRDPTGISTRHLGAVLGGSMEPEALGSMEAELRECLAADAVNHGESLWCVTPAAADPAALGAVLAVARRAGGTVGGFIDGATLCAAAAGARHDALVVEFGLHHLGVTSVAAGQLARRRRSIISRGPGWIALLDAWLDLIRSMMVNRTRVDPLRDADAEQQLFDKLPALAREAVERGTAVSQVIARGEIWEIEITRDQLATAAQPVAGELLRLIGQLRMPGAAFELIAPAALATLPGIDTALNAASIASGRQLLLDEGFAAAAASLRPVPESQPPDVVPFVRRAAAHTHDALQSMILRREAAAADVRQRATHVLYQGHAFALREGPLVVGGGAGEGNTIVLPSNSAGVSRRHCTFVSIDAEVALIDHSRYGTFLNGERVVERTRVRPGDNVRIGETGFELSLIAIQTG